MSDYGLKRIRKTVAAEKISAVVKKNGIISLSNFNTGLKGFLAYQLCRETGKNILILTAKDLNTVKKQYTFPNAKPEEKPVIFSPEPVYAYFADAHSKEAVRQRLKVLETLLQGHHQIVITSAEALLKKLPRRDAMNRQFLHLQPGDCIEHTDLIEQLTVLGYERAVQVEGRGQFAVRGEIVDVFGMTANQPWRIDFFDNEIESIKIFDLYSQRSIAQAESITLSPAAEQLSETEASLFNYLENPVIILDEPDAVRTSAEEFLDEIHREMDRLIAANEIMPGIRGNLFSVSEWVAQMADRPQIHLSAFNHFDENAPVIDCHAFGAESVNGQIPIFVEMVQRKVAEGNHVYLCCRSHQTAEKMPLFLEEQGLKGLLCREGPGLSIEPAEVAESFALPTAGLMYFNESSLFTPKEAKKRRRKFKGRKIDSFAQLSVGDYVVHDVHGIGIYRGIEQIEINETIKDMMVIEYAGNDRFYLPIEQMDAVQAYIGNGADQSPKVNQLGNPAWSKAKSKARKAVEDIADELVQLYAERHASTGFPFGQDTVWQREFEDAFPYDETDDQLRCVEEIKADMEKPVPMDRLLCGDVGYGKTEVALRAAFKAIMDGKQVAMLVPTTILAQQHYETVTARFADYPVEIEVISRYKSKVQQEQIVRNVHDGKTDFLIGTHRLLSKDIGFKDLGLLIIDEEQRFGVKAKEKLKSMKANVDVLTLSATPIPRTLHMSMSGVRDMSVIEEPPYGRKPVQTYVMRYNEIIIRDAINRELARGGQVYFVHNRVQDIEEVAAQVQRMVPNARIVTAHGRMTGIQLEKIMKDFLDRRFDILVTTTIIESGMDIANANTLIVDRGDHFGLSQLYQLRGRVGRSPRQAYCYVTHRKEFLNETAQKRLKAIKDFTAFGSGFKIAMRDLEIRGAGNILGAEQSGHLFNIGYEMYCRILEETIQNKLEGKTTQHVSVPVKIDLNIDAYVPEQYIKDEILKFDIYKKLSYVRSEKDFEDMEAELLDRFGKVPQSVRHLMVISRIKYLAAALGMINIRQQKHTVFFTFESADNVPVPDAKIIYQLYERFGLKLKAIKTKDNVWCIEVKTKEPMEQLKEILTFLMMI